MLYSRCCNGAACSKPFEGPPLPILPCRISTVCLGTCVPDHELHLISRSSLLPAAHVYRASPSMCNAEMPVMRPEHDMLQICFLGPRDANRYWAAGFFWPRKCRYRRPACRPCGGWHWLCRIVIILISINSCMYAQVAAQRERAMPWPTPQGASTRCTQPIASDPLSCTPLVQSTV